MQFSRRGLILGCAALTASCAATPKAPIVAQLVVPALDAPEIAGLPEVVAELPQTRLDPTQVIRKPLLDGALAALEQHGDRIPVRDHIFLVDFTRHSSLPRLYRLDLKSGQVETYRTAHGRGSDPAHSGFAERFSNVIESNASSVGAYVTAGQSSGVKHGENVLLEGLDPTNSHARTREIIVHTADYCEAKYLAQYGKLGRSNGCFAMSKADFASLGSVMDAGRLLFAAA
jgi:hypothetical protein